MARALALRLAVVALLQSALPFGALAHRLDEYLLATLVHIEPDGVSRSLHAFM